jgi:hypothetical protein
MVKKIIWASFYILFALSALATNAPLCKKDFTLLEAFNIADFQYCQSLIKKCPASAALPDEACVEKMTKKEPRCTQLREVAEKVHGTPATLTAESKGTVTLIEQLFRADGQNQYYIISSNSCLIDTMIDPRTLSASLRKKYKKVDFFIVNSGDPVFQTLLTGEKAFTVPLKVTDTCRACKAVGVATLVFQFDQGGTFQHVRLQNFKKGNS